MDEIKDDSITVRIIVAGRDRHTSIVIPKAVAVAEITVDPETGQAVMSAAYQNSGGALKVGDIVIPSEVTVRFDG